MQVLSVMKARLTFFAPFALTGREAEPRVRKEFCGRFGAAQKNISEEVI